jgi:hypothetical protein
MNTQAGALTRQAARALIVAGRDRRPIAIPERTRFQTMPSGSAFKIRAADILSMRSTIMPRSFRDAHLRKREDWRSLMGGMLGETYREKSTLMWLGWIFAKAIETDSFGPGRARFQLSF